MNRIIISIFDLQIFRFLLVGLLSALFELSLLVLFVNLSLNYLIGNAFAFLLTNLFNYALSRIWVFDPGSRSLRVEISIFYVVVLVGLAINQSVLYLLVEYGRIDYRIAKVAAIVATVIWNYFGKKRLVFENI